MEDVVWIVNYDPNWAVLFERERANLLDALGAEITKIEHIGSTSVSGLAAKPIVDILIGLRQLVPTLEQISCLEQLGYVYEGQVLNIPEHHFFRILINQLCAATCGTAHGSQYTGKVLHASSCLEI